MSNKLKLKKGDAVVVISGGQKGQEGVISRIIPADNKAVVEGVNLVTKHAKPTSENPGEIKKIEAPIHISNLAIKSSKGPSRVGYKTEGDKKVRFSKKTGEIIK